MKAAPFNLRMYSLPLG